MTRLSGTGREFVPVRFGHNVSFNIFTETEVQDMVILTQYIEDTYEPYEGGAHFQDGGAQWNGWNLDDIQHSTLSNILSKVKTAFRNMLNEEAVEEEKDGILQAYDHLLHNFPAVSTYHLYRQGTDDSIAEHADTYNIFRIAIITIEEQDNVLIVENRGKMQSIGPADTQFIAQNVRHSVPRANILYNRKTLTFAF